MQPHELPALPPADVQQLAADLAKVQRIASALTVLAEVAGEGHLLAEELAVMRATARVLMDEANEMRNGVVDKLREALPPEFVPGTPERAMYEAANNTEMSAQYWYERVLAAR